MSWLVLFAAMHQVESVLTGVTYSALESYSKSVREIVVLGCTIMPGQPL